MCCRAKQGGVTPCLPARMTASSSRQEASTAASIRSTPSTWTRDVKSSLNRIQKRSQNCTAFFRTKCNMYDPGQHIHSRLKLSTILFFAVMKTNQSENLIGGRAGGKLPNIKSQRGNLVGFKVK